MSEIARFNLAVPAARGAAWAAEARELMKLAGPLVATQLAQMAIMTTDVVMVGRLGETPLAGAALGGTVFFFAWLIGLGPSAAVSPLIAHILGAAPDDRASVRAVVRMGLWSVMILSLPLAAFLLFAKDVLMVFGQQPALAEAAGRFLIPLCLGLPCSLGYQVLRNYATALGKPNTSLWVMAVTIVFNALGDYALIFGHFGMPRLELVGSGIASACSYAFSMLAMTMVVFAVPALRKYRIFRRFARPQWSKFAELFHLGIPIGLTMIFEAMLFNAVVLLQGTFGSASVAAHQIALNVSSITYMVPLGIAMAATVRVGLAAGAGDRAGVRRAGYSAIAIAAVFMSLCAVVIAAFPHAIARLYFSANANAETVDLAAVFLVVAAAYQVFDGIQVTAALSLRGLKDAHMPMWIAAACYWLAGFPVCIGLGIALDLKGPGIWIGLAFSIFLAAVALSLRFRHLTREV